MKLKSAIEIKVSFQQNKIKLFILIKFTIRGIKIPKGCTEGSKVESEWWGA